ncbi:MAG: SsrA-binding protein SmpB [Actinobacteria bacterium]|nr:SsrA-binding protein SmpB [Actinomycetota bacterium]
MGKKKNKKASKDKSYRGIIAQNKKARKDFFILEQWEAGIELHGSEVKSVREHRVNLKDSYARIRKDQLYLFSMHISPYTKSRTEESNPLRTRRLLMHRREIDRIRGKLTDRSLTLVPLSVYFKDNRVKVEIALAKSKTKRDKREDIIKREHDTEIKRALKNY